MRRVDGDNELRRVTPAILRQAEHMCPRRLKHEFESGSKLNRYSDARFEVSNRLTEDARLAHAELRRPRAEAFVDPTDIEPEQQALYRAGAKGYLKLFGDGIVVSHDIGRSTDESEIGVRLSGTPGLAVKDANGRAEIRVLRIGSPNTRLDEVDISFTLLRAGAWAGDTLDVVVADVLALDSTTYNVRVDADTASARTWLTERIATIEARVDRSKPRAGADCRSCTCIPGCPALTASS